MRLAALGALVRRDLRRSLRSFSVSALGIAVGIASLMFFLALAAGMSRVVLGKIFPIDRIEVVPRGTLAGAVEEGVESSRAPSVSTTLSSAASAGAVEEGVESSRAPGIEPGTIARLRAIPGVRAVYPKMRLLFPSSGRGGRALFGRNLGAGELMADGIDPRLVQEDLVPGASFEDPEASASRAACTRDLDCNEPELCVVPLDRGGNPSGPGECKPPIPAVISPYLVEIFNGAIAPAHGMRRLDSDVLRNATGLELEWDLGRAGLGQVSRGQQRREHVRIVGISSRAIDLGITVPLAVARRLNREYVDDAAGEHFTSAVVALEHPSVTGSVSARVRQLGLEVKTSGAEQMGLLVAVITAILSLTSVIVIVVAALNIAQVFFTLIAERRGEIGLMRALGATRSDVRAIVLTQAAALGVIASTAGVLIARLAAWGCNHLAATRLPAFPFKPDNWFVFTPMTTVAVVGFGVGACVLSAIAPAVRASRIEPAAALAGGVG